MVQKPNPGLIQGWQGTGCDVGRRLVPLPWTCVPKDTIPRWLHPRAFLSHSPAAASMKPAQKRKLRNLKMARSGQGAAGTSLSSWQEHLEHLSGRERERWISNPGNGVGFNEVTLCKCHREVPLVVSIISAQNTVRFGGGLFDFSSLPAL